VPNLHWGWVSIVSRCPTWLKKEPLQAKNLPSTDKAKVLPARSIRRCKVLDRKNDHTYLETGLGEWWVEDKYWDGLTDEGPTVPYAINRDLIYLKDFPYFQQHPDEYKDSQAFTMAMCLKYLKTPAINSVIDYLDVLNKYGESLYRSAHCQALIELGMGATFTHSADSQDIMDEIHSGRPVAASLLSRGDITEPSSGTHLVAITGYGKDYWLVQDPFGEMDLINGLWSTRHQGSGRDVKYSFEGMNARLFASGGASGWCWVNFRKR
jgi:hypothetical protein